MVSFSIKNSINVQQGQGVNVLAGGSLPVSSTKMSAAGGQGSPMLIGDLGVSQSIACESSLCTTGAFCGCSASFVAIPTGRKVYALMAEIQCNGGTGLINITSPQSSFIQASLVQPPGTCKGLCDKYFTLISGIDITSLVTSGSLLLGASVDRVGNDICMAGKHLRVIFTLQYSRS